MSRSTLSQVVSVGRAMVLVVGSRHGGGRASGSGLSGLRRQRRSLDTSATISQSDLRATGSGQDVTLANNGGSAKVAVSQVVGGVQASGNSVQSFDNYDENLNAVN